MPPTHRVYGGVGGPERVAERRSRLLAAGLELLGTPNGVLTVRGVCKESGLIARYFYESFDDVDALAVAVYEEITRDLVAQTIADMDAVPSSDRLDRLRSGLGAVVDHVTEDPRRGHVLFVASLTTPALAPRRPGVITIFTEIVRAHADPASIDVPEHQLESTARFLVGGFGEVLTGWQNGTLQTSKDQVVDDCVALFAAVLGQSARNR